MNSRWTVDGGSPCCSSLSSFDGILFSDNGHVVTRSRLGNGDEGYFSASPSEVATIAVEGALAPGTSDTFQRIDSSLRISDAGDIAFDAVLDTFTDPIGIWTGQAGTLSLLARQGVAAPGGSGDDFFILSDFPRISAAGKVGFASLLFGLNARAGLWKGTPGSLGAQVVATQSDYRYAFLSDDEAWVFLDQSISVTPRILEGLPGNFRVVHTLGDPAPGVPGATIAFFPDRPDLRVNGSNQVAFRASLDEVDRREGLWSEGSGTLDLLALQGEIALGTGGLKYDEIEGFAINDLGQTAFWASFEAFAGQGLFFAHPGEAPQLVVRDSGTFEVGPGDVRTVEFLSTVLESAAFLRQHERGGFNNAGELAVGLRFTGVNDAGVYVVTVPEPQGELAALCALAILAGMATFRPRGRSAAS